MRAYIHVHIENSDKCYWLTYDKGKATLSNSVLYAEAVHVSELQVHMLGLINAGHRPVEVVIIKCENNCLTQDMRKTLNLC